MTREVRPDTNGRYSMAGLPPGNYLVAALTSIEPGDLADPAFFEIVAAAAVPISLTRGENRTLDLKLGSPAR
jgi:hypothetical protein